MVLEGVQVTAEDVLVTRTPKAGLVVASQGEVVVGLETALSPELVAEGLAREFVSRVQSMRKEADFEVTQRIELRVGCDDEVRAALESHRDYVMNETLTTALLFDSAQDAGVDINGHPVSVKVSPVTVS